MSTVVDVSALRVKMTLYFQMVQMSHGQRRYQAALMSAKSNSISVIRRISRWIKNREFKGEESAGGCQRAATAQCWVNVVPALQMLIQR